MDKLKPWYFLQENPHAAYDIYNPNKTNAYVCQVCSHREAVEIVNAMNTRAAPELDEQKVFDFLSYEYMPKAIASGGIDVEDLAKSLTAHLTKESG